MLGDGGHVEEQQHRSGQKSADCTTARNIQSSRTYLADAKHREPDKAGGALLELREQFLEGHGGRRTGCDHAPCSDTKMRRISAGAIKAPAASFANG